MLDYQLAQETVFQDDEPLDLTREFRIFMPRLRPPEQETEQEHAERVRLMAERFEKGQDLYSGDGLQGQDLADRKRVQAEQETAERCWERRRLNAAADTMRLIEAN